MGGFSIAWHVVALLDANTFYATLTTLKMVREGGLEPPR